MFLDRRRSRIVAWLALAVMVTQSALGGDWPFRRRAKPDVPNSLEQVARSIDAVEDKILDDGTVVLKQPDVYGQSRMTLYRKNFEQQLYGAITNFNVILSARVARSDQAAFASQTALQSALVAGAGRRGARTAPSAGGAGSASSSSTTNMVSAGDSGSPFTTLPSLFPPGTIAANAPFSGLGGHPFANVGGGAYQLGLEPTVYLDQLKNYQDHLNELRRVNMGDDIADSAGYGLYLIRMPISIQPGELTHRGHGAVLTATVRHDFGKEFLYKTYRNLIINDIVDVFSPILYETIRAGALDRFAPRTDTWQMADLYKKHKNKGNPNGFYALTGLLGHFPDLEQQEGIRGQNSTSSRSSAGDTNDANNANNVARGISQYLDKSTEILPLTRVNNRVYPIAASDMDDIFIVQNIAFMADNARRAQTTDVPRANAVRAYLRNMAEAAYDVLMSPDVDPAYDPIVDEIARLVRNRQYDEHKGLAGAYIRLAAALPGDLKYFNDPKVGRDAQDTLVRPLTILCYWIAVEAGLLDEQLRTDMRRAFGDEGPAGIDVDALTFHSRLPSLQAERAFQEYVKRRWPIITFALEPIIDEQNIADASSIRRDLQLALAFAFSTGQIGFSQMIQYQRRLEIDAETIALNRKVTAFAHGNETFGFRFTPRYQNPPMEKSNLSAAYNQIVKGGPGRDYQIRNSKLESGQRELNVAIIMPSFLQGVQMDVIGNWFPLHDPDEMEIPRARMIEQGRKVMKLRHDLATLEACGEYRPGDVRRLGVQVDQLEAMLPMQSIAVRVPYENTLGGFQLFQEGSTALVPQLLGFEGAETIDPETETDLLIYGKHISIQETKVVVGGKYLQGKELDVDKAAAAVAAGADALAKQADAAKASSDATSGGDISGGDGSKASTAGGSSSDAATKGGSAKGQSGSAVQNATTKQAEALKSSTNALKSSVAANKTQAGSGTMSPTGASTPTPSGGVDNPYVEIVSREVIRIKVPAGTQTTTILNADAAKQKTTQYVEIYVATPNGISNRLLVPVKAKEKAKPDAKPSGYSLSTNQITMAFNVPTNQPGPLPQDFDSGLSQPPLTFRLEEPSGIVPKHIAINFQFGTPGAAGGPDAVDGGADTSDGMLQAGQAGKVKTPKVARFTIDGVPHLGNGVYQVDSARLAAALCSIDPVKALFTSGAGEGSVLTKTITLQPRITSGDFDVIAKKSADNLTVNLRFVLVATHGASPQGQAPEAPNELPPAANTPSPFQPQPPKDQAPRLGADAAAGDTSAPATPVPPSAAPNSMGGQSGAAPTHPSPPSRSGNLPAPKVPTPNDLNEALPPLPPSSRTTTSPLRIERLGVATARLPVALSRAPGRSAAIRRPPSTEPDSPREGAAPNTSRR